MNADIGRKFKGGKGNETEQAFLSWRDLPSSYLFKVKMNAFLIGILLTNGVFMILCRWYRQNKHFGRQAAYCINYLEVDTCCLAQERPQGFQFPAINLNKPTAL